MNQPFVLSSLLVTLAEYLEYFQLQTRTRRKFQFPFVYREKNKTVLEKEEGIT